ASASAAIRPVYLLPPRSKTTVVTPASLARWAMSCPTLTDWTVLLPSLSRRSGSREEAAAQVCPLVSSMSWTTRCLEERKTARRGRSGVPLIRFRARLCLRRRAVVRLAVRLRLTVLAMPTYQPFRPCGGCTHPGTARPWPCRGRACADREYWQRSDPPAACRFPPRGTAWAFPPGK